MSSASQGLRQAAQADRHHDDALVIAVELDASWRRRPKARSRSAGCRRRSRPARRILAHPVPGRAERNIGCLAEDALLEEHVAGERPVEVAAQRPAHAGQQPRRSRPSRSCRRPRRASRRSGHPESRNRSMPIAGCSRSSDRNRNSRLTSSSALIAPWNRIERTISAVLASTRRSTVSSLRTAAALCASRLATTCLDVLRSRCAAR